MTKSACVKHARQIRLQEAYSQTLANHILTLESLHSQCIVLCKPRGCNFVLLVHSVPCYVLLIY